MKIAKPYGESDKNDLMKSVYCLISKVWLAEEIQELFNSLEKKSDNKVPVFEVNSQEFTVKEEMTKQTSHC